MAGSGSFRLAISPDAGKVIRGLPPEVKRSVKAAMRVLSGKPEEGHPLVGELQGLWKYRVRRYRIVYEINRRARVLRVVAVGHRRGIYEEVAERIHAEGP